MKRRTVVLMAGGIAAALALAGWVFAPRIFESGPRPAFQLPVACGEAWLLGTYPGHDDFDIDLFPARGPAWGRPVLASYAGTVIEAGINGTLGARTQQNPKGPRGSGGGYWVRLDHGGRWQTQYLHLLEPPMVEQGQRVQIGQQIGKVGSTGRSGAAHLHYEQRIGRQKVEAYFAGRPSGITTDDREYEVRHVSENCPAPSPARSNSGTRLPGSG